MDTSNVSNITDDLKSNSWLYKLFGYESNTGHIVDDTLLTSMINNSDLNVEQKQDLKKSVQEDDVATYNIHIDTITSNNLNELINEIKQAQINKK